ncbi:MAG: retropepsin-like aspartic protease [bacterium]|nr:retropepsin-like aspartic protease [bacterium]
MSLNFNPKEGLIVVPTRLFGSQGDIIVHLALDTGATGSLINWDVAVLVGYDPGVVQDRVQVTTGSGVEFAPRIEIIRIETLEIVRENFPIICHTLPPSANVDGLLGLDFFRNTYLNIDLVSGSVDVKIPDNNGEGRIRR